MPTAELKAKTSQAIAVVKERLMHNPDETQKLISDLGQLAFNAKDALASDDIEKLGEIFNAAQTILRQLGVSCAQLDDLIALSLKNGSLGSKLTGGGKGGCFICLTKSIDDASGLSQALLDAGATQTWIEPLLKEAVHEYSPITARAHTNIALIKYWGKKDVDLIIPQNSSLSLTLDHFIPIQRSSSMKINARCLYP